MISFLIAWLQVFWTQIKLMLIVWRFRELIKDKLFNYMFLFSLVQLERTHTFQLSSVLSFSCLFKSTSCWSTLNNMKLCIRVARKNSYISTIFNFEFFLLVQIHKLLEYLEYYETMH